MTEDQQNRLNDLLADWLMEWAGRPHRPYRSVRALLRDLQDAGFIVEVEP